METFFIEFFKASIPILSSATAASNGHRALFRKPFRCLAQMPPTRRSAISTCISRSTDCR